MTERTIPEILGWRYSESIDQWCDPNEVYAEGKAWPDVDDMLAWLHARQGDVYVEAMYASEGDREAGRDRIPVKVEFVPDGPADSVFAYGATVLAAVEAAVRAVAGETDQ